MNTNKQATERATKSQNLSNDVVVKCLADGSWLKGFSQHGTALFTPEVNERGIFKAGDSRLESFLEFGGIYEVRDITVTPDANIAGGKSTRNKALSSWLNEYGEGVIHANDYAYFEACEAGLKACLKYLRILADTFDGARAGDDAQALIVGIDTLFDGADPLRGTEGESFVRDIHRKRDSNRFELGDDSSGEPEPTDRDEEIRASEHSLCDVETEAERNR